LSENKFSFYADKNNQIITMPTQQFDKPIVSKISINKFPGFAKGKLACELLLV
jgi:hypothetical protein